MLSKANFLILDEPTNHLDATSKEILENALNEYEGTLLYVSHDRYFINQTATRILELSDGNFTSYPGNYDYYLEKKGEAEKPDVVSEAKLSWQEQKAADAEKRKTANRIRRIEEEIGELESRQNLIEESMQDPETATDAEKLTALSEESAGITEKLEKLLEEWEALSQAP